jgi:hypothetical protein
LFCKELRPGVAGAFSFLGSLFPQLENIALTRGTQPGVAVLLDFFSGVLQDSRPIFLAGSVSQIVKSLRYSRQV